MYKFYILIILLTTSGISFGQKYNTVDIIKRTDSIIIAAVGKNVFDNNYSLDSTKEGEAWQKTYDKERKIKRIVLGSKTTKHFTFIAVDYIFYINKYQKPFYQTRIILDKNLNSQFPVDTSFIPKYILRGTKSDFLTESAALEIAKAKFRKKGTKSLEASLTYDYTRKFYIWTVENILNETKDAYGAPWRQIEYLELNAVTGQILNYQQNSLQGRVY